MKSISSDGSTSASACNLSQIWYQKNILSYILFPLSLLYRIIIFIRRLFYKIKLFKIHKINAPVIIVGNITVGGTGKTPLVIALVKTLQNKGFYPGVILRGYGGKSKTWPMLVTENSDPTQVGDEAVLIAKKTGAPVVAGPNRVNDARQLLATSNCNIVISDDGLQHYALARDIEIAVMDGTRRLGNGFCLPAGPLREPASRLNTVDFIITNGKARAGEFEMQFVIDDIINLIDNNKKLDGSEIKNKKITVIAGIGNPERFFTSLRELGLTFTTNIFPDHYCFSQKDFNDIKDNIILMTEKDAVKCRAFSDTRFYMARGHAVLNDQFINAVISKHPFTHVY